MSRLSKEIQNSKQLILNLEEIVQMNYAKYESNKNFWSLYSQLRKSQRQMGQKTQYPLRKCKIKKDKKSVKNKPVRDTQMNLQKVQLVSDNNFMQLLRCHEQIDMGYFSLASTKYRLYEQTQKDLLQNFVTDFVEQICYEQHRRKSLLQIQPKQFLKILIRIENQFQHFLKGIHEQLSNRQLSLSEKKFNEQQLQKRFIAQIQLFIPEIKEVLQNFEDKYDTNPEYKTQYRQLLMKKRIIYNIKRNIERRNDSEQDNYCNNFQLISQKQQQIHTQQIYSTLNPNGLRQRFQNPLSYYEWQQMKAKMQQFALKMDQEEELVSKKKKKKKLKRKGKTQQQNQIDQQNKKINQLSEYLQGLQIDQEKTSQCRLEQQWMNEFRSKHTYGNSKNSRAKKFNFKDNTSKQVFKFD